MSATQYQIRLMLAIDQARAAGFNHFAAALAELLRKEIAR